LKRKELIKRLENAGFKFARHGANHDVYECNGRKEMIPRHAEINEKTGLKSNSTKRNGTSKKDHFRVGSLKRFE